MTYSCPRCSQPVQRGHSTRAQIVGGLVGALLYGAFGDYQCKSCGKIARSEFPQEVRIRMNLGSLAMVLSAIVLVAIFVCLLSLQH